MKKLITLITLAAVMLSMLGVSAFAASYNPNFYCDIKFDVKQANSANVVKDGVIGTGEYEKLDVNLDPGSTSLNLTYGSSEAYESAERLLSTMEYYFSWDETHGLNFAIRFKPDEIKQEFTMGTDPEKPGDAFLNQTGIQVELDTEAHRGEYGTLYYSIAKSTVDGSYLEGHYGQLGVNGNYDPTPLTDYYIDYSNGYVTAEWSLPLDTVGLTASAGTQVCLSICAMAGVDDESAMNVRNYGVSFGDYGYLVAQDDGSQNAVATLSAEKIPDGINPDPNPPTDTDPNPDPNPSTDPDDTTTPGTDTTNGGQGTTNGGGTTTGGDTTTPGGKGEPTGNNTTNGSNNSSTNNNSGNNNTNAPATGDPMMILAAVSAISACGVAVYKKRH